MTALLPRVAVAVVAVVAIAWLAVQERDVRLQARGTADAQHLDMPGNAVRAEDALLAARLLSPDTAPDVRRAFVLRATERQDQAIALLEDVVRREPDNLTAWGLIATFARDRDPAAVARAFTARARLDPLNARAR